MDQRLQETLIFRRFCGILNRPGQFGSIEKAGMHMNSTTVLPQGYHETEHINLQTDKKTALRINITALIVMVALMVLGHFAFCPIVTLYGESGGALASLLRLGVLLAAYFAYIILHELTHAAAMKLSGGTNLRFGFTGLYAYAGSEKDYFNKAAYIVIALAPLAVWGVIFTVLLLLVPTEWFWVVYFLQIGNLTGAAGDIYVTAKIIKMPRDVLVMDTGVEMFFYTK